MRKRRGVRTIICSVCSTLGHTEHECKRRKRELAARRSRQLAMRKEREAEKERLWLATRRRWIKQNPPDKNHCWYCHYCGVPLTNEWKYLSADVGKLSLDHKHPRKSIVGEELVHDLENLVPCCYEDNRLKGSLSYVTFCRKYYPHLLKLLGDKTPKVVGGLFLDSVSNNDTDSGNRLHW